MEITAIKTLIKEDRFNEKEIASVVKQFNTYLNLIEIKTKKEFTKNLRPEMARAKPIFDEVILAIFYSIRKAYNDIHKS
jgi:hypothetical protein